MKPTVNASARGRSSSSASKRASSVERAILAGIDDGASLRAESPRQKVVRAIISGLYDGRYVAGQRLVEAELTAEHGISRGPVREALNRLAATGAITLTPASGAQVRRLDLDQAIDILQVASTLLCLTARLAAQRIEPDGAARLESAARELARFEASDNGAAFALARTRFYNELVVISGNHEVARIVPTIQIHLIRRQFAAALMNTDRLRHAIYARICSAVLRGDAQDAEDAVGLHFRVGLEALERTRTP